MKCIADTLRPQFFASNTEFSFLRGENILSVGTRIQRCPYFGKSRGSSIDGLNYNAFDG